MQSEGTYIILVRGGQANKIHTRPAPCHATLTNRITERDEKILERSKCWRSLTAEMLHICTVAMSSNELRIPGA